MDVKEKELEKNENSENLSYQDNVENKKENKEENLNLIPSQDSNFIPVKEEKKTLSIFNLLIIIVLSILIICFLIFTAYNTLNSNIISGVHIKGLDVSNMSMSDAKYQLDNYLNNTNKKISASDVIDNKGAGSMTINVDIDYFGFIKQSTTYDFLNAVTRRVYDDDIDFLVYTAAIKEDNVEMIEAKKKKIPMMERGEFLGEITKLYSNTIGIAGTHGKTSTTSMVSLIFLEAGRDPTIQVGSILSNINGNYRVGKSDTLIIEACEYCDSFLSFKQKSAIILNIDNDHLDYFKNLENIKKSFDKFTIHMCPAPPFIFLTFPFESVFENPFRTFF